MPRAADVARDSIRRRFDPSLLSSAGCCDGVAIIAPTSSSSCGSGTLGAPLGAVGFEVTAAIAVGVTMSLLLPGRDPDSPEFPSFSFPSPSSERLLPLPGSSAMLGMEFFFAAADCRGLGTRRSVSARGTDARVRGTGGRRAGAPASIGATLESLGRREEPSATEDDTKLTGVCRPANASAVRGSRESLDNELVRPLCVLAWSMAFISSGVSANGRETTIEPGSPSFATQIWRQHTAAVGRLTSSKQLVVHLKRSRLAWRTCEEPDRH